MVALPLATYRAVAGTAQHSRHGPAILRPKPVQQPYANQHGDWEAAQNLIGNMIGSSESFAQDTIDQQNTYPLLVEAGLRRTTPDSAGS